MHRPTFHNAQGGNQQGAFRVIAPSKAISVKDILGNAELKTRHYDKEEEEKVKTDKKELKRQLELKEEQGKSSKKGKTEPEEMDGVAALEWLQEHNPDDAGASSNESESESESDSDDEELLRELEKIKKERSEEAIRKQRAMEEQESMQKREVAANSNPLLAESQSVSKKWYEDTVFRNQAKNLPKEKKRFVNDTIRSDFHRKFLDRFIK